MATRVNKLACVDPLTLYRSCAEQSPPLPTDAWWGKANSFAFGPGREPGRGWVLLSKANLDSASAFSASDPDATLTFTGTDKEHSLVLQKITILKVTCCDPGAPDDPDATYLCEVVDRRHFLAMIPLTDGYRAYNLRDSNGDHLSGSLDDGDPWTWQALIDDLVEMCDEETTEFELPFDPDGDPENFIFHDCGPWEALNRVLDRLACTAVYDPVADTFSVARLGEQLGALSDKDKRLSTYDKVPRLWDGYESETARGWRPEKIQVRFIRRPQPTNGANPYYVKEVTLPDAAEGVVSGSAITLEDDLTAIGATGTPENSDDLDTRAQERVDDWLRKRQFYERPVLRVWVDFLPTATSLAGYAVGRIMFDDRGGPFATAVKAEPDGALEKFETVKPWENIPGDGDATGCGWPAALTKNDCLRVSVLSGEGRCGCVDTEQAERKLTSTDGQTWGIQPGSIGTGTGCLDGMELPNAGIMGLTERDPEDPLACFIQPVPFVSVGEMHWATVGLVENGELHLECVEGEWTAYQETTDVQGELVDQFCLVDGNGTAVATVRVRFSLTSPCTIIGIFSFQFVVDECAGTEGPTIKICESDVLVTFKKNCCGLPKLILTGFESAEVCCGDDFAESVTVTVTKDDVTYTGEWAGDGTSYSGELEEEDPGPTVMTDCCEEGIPEALTVTFSSCTGGHANFCTLGPQPLTWGGGSWDNNNLDGLFSALQLTCIGPNFGITGSNETGTIGGSAAPSSCSPFQVVFTGVSYTGTSGSMTATVTGS